MKILLAVVLASFASVATAAEPDMTQIAQDIATGKMSSVALVQTYLRRIRDIDDSGPTLNAVMALYPDVIAQARAFDAERNAGKLRGPLHGVPILIKDNVEVAGPIPTTAGSLALKDNVTGRDAPIIARLRAAGAIILGKTNLSEWANIRSSSSSSGWSAVGGLTRNPHVLNRSACGSSSGSGAAIAAGLAAGAIGTETDGSITCPAGLNGIVGFKPSVGLVSRTHIVPISFSQDSAGPMTASVRDAALMLNVIAGNDLADPATAEADRRRTDYVAALSPTALKGLRIGVLRDRIGSNGAIIRLFDDALAVMRTAGATLVEIKESRKGTEPISDAEFTVLLFELKASMATYLASLPNNSGPKTLADLIAFNKAHAPTEMAWFGQDTFEQAQARGGLDDPAYKKALADSQRLAGPDGIDRLLRENGVDLLVGVTNGPAWVIDLVNGDNFIPPSASELPAVAGYPNLTVPMGGVKDLPIGVSFIGTKWDDARVLAAGNAYEMASHKKLTPRCLKTIETDGQ